MDESQEMLLLKSLEDAGVSIPNGVASIRELTPETLVSICAQGLNLLDDTVSLPASLPDSMVDRFRIGTDIALAVKRLGYLGDMTYVKLLYPSEEDLYKLVRFLVERLSKSSDGVNIADAKGVSARGKKKEGNSTSNLEDLMENADIEKLKINHLKEKVKDASLHKEDPELFNSEAEDLSYGRPRTPNFHEDLTNMATENPFYEEGKSRGSALEHEEKVDPKDAEHVEKVTSLSDLSSKVKYETEKFQNEETVFVEEVNVKASELQRLEEEFELLKKAAQMAFDDQHPIDFYIDQLSEQVEAKKCNILELESQWDAFKKPLEEKKRSLEELLYENTPEAKDKLQKLREAELEKQSVHSETKRREEEHLILSAEFEKQPKMPSRASYIERIKEITKNSWKQDADIERILKETRELQLESNSIQERLHRTYAVLDEIVFREAKKDPVARQAYRHLTSLHESFEKISEKSLAKDRIQREVAEYEKKLAAMASRSFNVDKLQADLDSIVRENEYLNQQLQEN